MQAQRLFTLSFLAMMLTIVGCGGSGSFNASPIVASAASTNPPGSATSGSTAPSTSSTTTTTPGSTTTPGTTTAGNTSPSNSTSGNPPPSSSAANPPASGTASDAAATSTPQVVITSPADGATVDSPAQVSASTSGSSAIGTMQLYVDDAIAFQVSSEQVSTALQLSGGTHTIVAQAWDQSGNSYKSAPVHVNIRAAVAAVPPPPPAPPAPAPPPPAPEPPPPPATNANASQIQRMPSWDSCAVCAGAGGSGPDTSHGMTEGISSPSLSGSSARFDVGGTAWGAALWWRELGGHNEAQNLRYDLDFYVESVANAQALEFDTNQNAGGNRYIFGTECDFRGSGTWRVWNTPAGRWVSTGIGCSAPATGTWHHLTWEFQRAGGQVHFVAVTLDGQRHDVGMSFDAIQQGGSGLDVAFQADLTASGGNVSVWLDNVSLSW